MNRKQRMKNRNTGLAMSALAHHVKLSKHVCENCGEFGGHWIETGFTTLEDIINGVEPQGFWTCKKYYGEDGRRIEP